VPRSGPFVRGGSGKLSHLGTAGGRAGPGGREKFPFLLQTARLGFLISDVQPENPRNRNVVHYASKHRQK